MKIYIFVENCSLLTPCFGASPVLSGLLRATSYCLC